MKLYNGLDIHIYTFECDSNRIFTESIGKLWLMIHSWEKRDEV